MEYTLNPLIKKPRPTLKEVYEIIKNWIYIKDEKRIDIVLATRLISRISGTRVWLLIVGASGDWKSELLNALDDDGIETKIIKRFTSRTLVNGNPKVPDLAPQLNNKTVIISDFAQLLKLHPNEKAEVWAQLRDLYDGVAGVQSGMGKDVLYKNLNVTLIGASTPAIDAQILIHQDLGTRELIYRSGKKEKSKIMEMVLKNEKVEDIMRYEMKEIINNFLKNKEYNKDLEVSELIEIELQYEALKLTYLRAPAEVDGYTGELLNEVYPEMPTRILKQLKRIYIALKSLDEDYSDERALSIIRHIVKSSSFKNRNDVLNLFLKNKTDKTDNSDNLFTTNKVATKLKIGNKTAYKELNILWNLGLMKRKIVLDDFNRMMNCEWWLNDKKPIVRDMMEELKDKKGLKEYIE